jgi:hypothetical protein
MKIYFKSECAAQTCAAARALYISPTMDPRELVEREQIKKAESSKLCLALQKNAS